MSKTLLTLEGCRIVQHDDKRVVFTSDGDIDADGANGQTEAKLAAYRPDNSGIEDLRNACYPAQPENYRSILVCDLQDRPIRQSASDPAPGAYITATAYEWPGLARTDPWKYVDAALVPYIVISPLIRRLARGVVLGCKARATNTKTGQSVDGVVADIGPRRKIGELSIAAARAIGIRSNPRNGGTKERIIRYEFWPDTPAVVNGVTYRLLAG